METTDQTIQVLGSLKFSSQEHLELFLQTMDKNSGLYCLVEAVKYAHSRGAYTIGEAEILAKSIRVLTKEEDKEDGTPETTR